MGLISLWPAIPAAILTALLAYGAHSLDVAATDKAHREALQAQQLTLQTQCIKDKQIVEKTANDYQTKVRRLTTQLNNVQRRPTAKCVAAGKANASDGTHPVSKLSDRNGLSTAWLRDFAFRAEQDRLKAEGLQAFINETWASRGQ